jgi:hypothetical protein
MPGTRSVLKYLNLVNRERTGSAALATVFATCAAVSMVGWLPLGAASDWLAQRLPIEPGTCAGLHPGELLMYPCSVKVGILVLAGPALLTTLLVLIRRQLARGLRLIVRRLPPDVRFLVGPALTTAVFTATWASLHSQTRADEGVLPQIVFPALIGPLAFLTTRQRARLQRLLAPYLTLRDRWEPWKRLLAAAGIPVVLSLLMTAEPRVSHAAMKGQITVLLALGAGYLAFLPRSDKA